MARVAAIVSATETVNVKLHIKYQEAEIPSIHGLNNVWNEMRFLKIF